ncbi:hypothetical protein [Caballeronia sp. GAWG1-1]|uniref:DUF7079 family protein n=1 Tax=Caballeronia sp. GAWG1-1 TaxID=2921742 RepID=UPI002027F59B|nr:hypothetical protein [Caballeronia sp. GAWG1-1]
MGHQIDQQARERIWTTMAEFFVDNKIDYDYQASKICVYPLKELKKIFFREVAPVCGPNALTAAPPIWLSFDDQTVIDEVRKLLLKRDASAFFRLRHELSVLYLRVTLNGIWQEVERAITRQRGRATCA